MRERLLRWFFIAVAIVAPVGLTGFGFIAQRDWTALHDHGVETTGHVTEKREKTTGKNAESAQASYEYEVDGQKHKIWEDLTDDEYARTRVGDEKRIIYLPEHPSTADSADYIERVGELSNVAFALWATSCVLVLIGVPCGWRLAHNQAKWRFLVSEGRATRTTAVELSKYTDNENRDTWTAHYTFELDGQVRSAQSGVDYDTAMMLQSCGGRATVLYDPNDPDRFALYAPLAKMYQIETNV